MTTRRRRIPILPFCGRPEEYSPPPPPSRGDGEPREHVRCAAKMRGTITLRWKWALAGPGDQQFRTVVPAINSDALTELWGAWLGLWWLHIKLGKIIAFFFAFVVGTTHFKGKEYTIDYEVLVVGNPYSSRVGGEICAFRWLAEKEPFPVSSNWIFPQIVITTRVITGFNSLVSVWNGLFLTVPCVEVVHQR